MKPIPYGTQVTHKDKNLYYSRYNYKTGFHLCYYSIPNDPYPKYISLKRDDFKLRHELKGKITLGEALM